MMPAPNFSFTATAADLPAHGNDTFLTEPPPREAPRTAPRLGQQHGRQPPPEEWAAFAPHPTPPRTAPPPEQQQHTLSGVGDLLEAGQSWVAGVATPGFAVAGEAAPAPARAPHHAAGAAGRPAAPPPRKLREHRSEGPEHYDSTHEAIEVFKASKLPPEQAKDLAKTIQEALLADSKAAVEQAAVFGMAAKAACDKQRFQRAVPLYARAIEALRASPGPEAIGNAAAAFTAAEHRLAHAEREAAAAAAAAAAASNAATTAAAAAAHATAATAAAGADSDSDDADDAAAEKQSAHDAAVVHAKAAASEAAAGAKRLQNPAAVMGAERARAALAAASHREAVTLAKTHWEERYAELLAGRARAWAGLGEHREAVEDLDEALLLAPRAVNLYIYKSEALAQLKQYADASATLLEGLARAPHNLKLKQQFDKCLQRVREQAQSYRHGRIREMGAGGVAHDFVDSAHDNVIHDHHLPGDRAGGHHGPPSPSAGGGNPGGGVAMPDAAAALADEVACGSLDKVGAISWYDDLIETEVAFWREQGIELDPLELLAELHDVLGEYKSVLAALFVGYCAQPSHTLESLRLGRRGDALKVASKAVRDHGRQRAAAMGKSPGATPGSTPGLTPVGSPHSPTRAIGGAAAAAAGPSAAAASPNRAAPTLSPEEAEWQRCHAVLKLLGSEEDEFTLRRRSELFKPCSDGAVYNELPQDSAAREAAAFARDGAVAQPIGTRRAMNGGQFLDFVGDCGLIEKKFRWPRALEALLQVRASNKHGDDDDGDDHHDDHLDELMDLLDRSDSESDGADDVESVDSDLSGTGTRASEAGTTTDGQAPLLPGQNALGRRRSSLENGVAPAVANLGVRRGSMRDHRRNSTSSLAGLTPAQIEIEAGRHAAASEALANASATLLAEAPPSVASDSDSVDSLATHGKKVTKQRVYAGAHEVASSASHRLVFPQFVEALVRLSVARYDPVVPQALIDSQLRWKKLMLDHLESAQRAVREEAERAAAEALIRSEDGPDGDEHKAQLEALVSEKKALETAPHPGASPKAKSPRNRRGSTTLGGSGGASASRRGKSGKGGKRGARGGGAQKKEQKIVRRGGRAADPGHVDPSRSAGNARPAAHPGRAAKGKASAGGKAGSGGGEGVPRLGSMPENEGHKESASAMALGRVGLRPPPPMRRLKSRSGSSASIGSTGGKSSTPRGNRPEPLELPPISSQASESSLGGGGEGRSHLDRFVAESSRPEKKKTARRGTDAMLTRMERRESNVGLLSMHKPPPRKGSTAGRGFAAPRRATSTLGPGISTGGGGGGGAGGALAVRRLGSTRLHGQQVVGQGALAVAMRRNSQGHLAPEPKRIRELTTTALRLETPIMLLSDRLRLALSRHLLTHPRASEWHNSLSHQPTYVSRFLLRYQLWLRRLFEYFAVADPSCNSMDLREFVFMVSSLQISVEGHSLFDTVECARTVVATQFFVGAPHRDRLRFHEFVVALWHCLEVRTHDGLAAADARVESYVWTELIPRVRHRCGIAHTPGISFEAGPWADTRKTLNRCATEAFGGRPPRDAWGVKGYVPEHGTGRDEEYFGTEYY